MKTYGIKTVARCVQRVHDGESMMAVAKSYGINSQTVHNWCRRAGVASKHNRRWTDEEIAILADMWAQGMSAGEIASKLCRTRKSIERYVDKHRGLTPRRR